MTKAQNKLSIASIVEAIERIDMRRENDSEDPITRMAGIGEELNADYDRHEKALLSLLLDRKKELSEERLEWVYDRCEVWMP